MKWTHADCDHKAVAWIQQGQILLLTIMLQAIPTPSFKNKQQKAYKMFIHKECLKKLHQLCTLTGAKGKFICVSNVNDVLN